MGINEKHLKHAVTTTQFIAGAEHEECNGCGECENRCQIHAIRMEGDYPVVDETYCLGCGVCARFCPSDAMKMREREKRVIPPKTYKELMVRLMKEKGRM
jgi:MinD superfamily P-loop ATPase